MHYMVSCLVLGDFFVGLKNLNKNGYENVDKSEISRWEKVIQKNGDEINITIEVPVVENAPYESLIPMADGIIYYLNPNNYEDVALFKDLINIIQKVRRDIPTIVVFHDNQKYVKFTGNNLLSWIWE